MENQFVSPVMCAPDWWRTSLRHLWCALQIDGDLVCVTCDVRSRLMENQFVSPVMCAPDWWRTNLCHLCYALQIDGDLVCVTCDVRSRLMENQFASPVFPEAWMIKYCACPVRAHCSKICSLFCLSAHWLVLSSINFLKPFYIMPLSFWVLLYDLTFLETDWRFSELDRNG